MQKIIILSLLLYSFLYSKEPLMATLVNITSNEVQHFKIGNYRFSCTPYGVNTLEELYRSANGNKSCQQAIYDFYQKESELAYYAHSKYNSMQAYSILFKDDKCLVNIDGEKTYSEFLLEKGLAIKIPNRLDKEYDFIFYKSQVEAKESRIGLWEFNIGKVCISSIYIKN